VTIVRFLLAWPNAPFTIAFGIALSFVLLQATGVLHLIGDHDHDLDHAGFGDAIFAAFGVGKIPFALIWQTWSIVFALVGWALNARYIGEADPPLTTLLYTAPAGLVAGGVVVTILSRALAPIFASKPHEATSRAELVGMSGVVISSRVTDDFGEVRVRDKSGHDLRVICRLAPGSIPPKEHQRVVVVDYVEESGALLVAPIDEPIDSNRSERRVS
jgi:hypothetical protein